MLDWSQLTIAGSALVVLFYMIYWNSKQQERRDTRQAERDSEQSKRYEGLLKKYAGVTTQVISVIGENTAAMIEVRVGSDGIKDAVKSINEFIIQADERLRSGKARFESTGGD